MSSTLQAKPSWISFASVDSGKTENDTNNGYGFDSGGMWITGGSYGTSYPIRCNFVFSESDVCEIVLTVLHGDCSDQSVCFFLQGTDPQWSWGTQSSRIAVSLNCDNLAIYGRTISNDLGEGALSSGYYTLVITYDPGAGTVTATAHDGQSVDDAVIGTISLSEVLPSGDYKIGFDADQDDSPTKSYFTYLKISRNGQELTGSRPALNYIHPQYTFQVITYTPQSLIALSPYPDSIEHLILNLQQTDVFVGNKKYRHGDIFTAYGMEAIRLKQLYVDVDNPVLQLYTPPVGGSIVFDNSGATCYAAGSADWAFGTGDFTVEWFQYHVPALSGAGAQRIFAVGSYPTASIGISFEPTAYVWIDGSYRISVSPNELDNKWCHFAITRSGSDLKLFQDGVEIGSATNSTDITDSSSDLTIGYESADKNGTLFGGYITNFHVIKGYAKYTAAFTPPSQQIEPIAESKLLLNTLTESTAFEDSSGNNVSITHSNVAWSESKPF